MNGNSIILNYKLPIIVVSLSVLYLGIVALFIGLRIDHIIIIVTYNFCFFLSPPTRKAILALTVFLVFGMLYDFMRVFPNYNFSNVDVRGLYEFDKAVFGLSLNGIKYSLNEFFNYNHNIILDIVSGIFYINWMSVPIGFAIYLFIKNKYQYLNFSLAFFLVNLIGFSIYYIHPAAPPWYVISFGMELNLNVPPGVAGLTRFDDLIGIPVFESIYSRNSNIFAALPSLHCAYPVVVLYYALKYRYVNISWLASIFMLGIWFSAIYSGHHYATDAVLGIFCALLGIAAYEKLLLNLSWFNRFVTKYKHLISTG